MDLACSKLEFCNELMYSSRIVSGADANAQIEMRSRMINWNISFPKHLSYLHEIPEDLFRQFPGEKTHFLDNNK